jgi:hypothetical protein
MPGAYRQQDNGVGAGLGIHLCLYCAVAACFAVGFYALLQPLRVPNPGLAAFKPLPGTIVTYVQLPPSRKDVAALAAPIAPAVLTQPELETTGRSTSQAQEPVSLPQMVEPPAQQPKAKPRREARSEARSESSAQQRAVCLPGYDSSGAQTRPC